jgi:hypothetical protein
MTDRYTPPEEQLLALLHQHASLGNGKARERLSNGMVANPMWNQNWFTEAVYANDELDRYPTGAGFPGKASTVVVGGGPASKADGACFPLQSGTRSSLPGSSFTFHSYVDAKSLTALSSVES